MMSGVKCWIAMTAEQAFVGTFEGCDGLAAAMVVSDQGLNVADHKVDVRQRTFVPWPCIRRRNEVESKPAIHAHSNSGAG